MLSESVSLKRKTSVRDAKTPRIGLKSLTSQLLIGVNYKYQISNSYR